MAVRIPIITDFDGKGIKRASAEFKQLEGVAAKTKFALKKAMIPATAALGGLAKLGTDAISAAMADEKAQLTLANTIKKTTGATDSQIAANEEWISTQGELFGVTDDDLRPAIAKLVRSTKDITKAQKLANLAMDIAAATGKDLSDVTDALAKAVNNNMKSLKSLAPELSDVIKKGGKTDEIFKRLADTFGGQAAAQAETTAGKMQRLKVAFDEFKEDLGKALLPLLENYVLPALRKFSDWAKEHPDTFKKIALAVGALSAAVVVLNVAMAANPWVLAIVGLAAFIIYLDDAYGILKGIIEALKTIADWAGKPGQIFGGAIKAFTGSEAGGRKNTSPFKYNIATGQQEIPFGGSIIEAAFAAEGGIRSSSGIAGLFGRTQGNQTTVNVNVNGGDPRAVVDAITRWSRQNGRLPPQIRTAQ